MTTREVSYNLSGCVRNMSLAVAGTSIVLYDYWTTGRGLERHFLALQTTGARGEFSFDVRKGIYCLEVIPNRDTRFARQTLDTIKVTTNTTFTINLQTGAILSGRVRTAGGEIVRGCEILVFGIEPSCIRAREDVDADGAYSIALPRGKYYLAVRHKGVQADADPESVSDLETGTFLTPSFHVVDLERDTRYALMLPELVRFKGAISNADGHPVPDVRVTISPTNLPDNVFAVEASLIAVCLSDKTGLFEVDVEPGTFDVKLEPGPNSHLSERLVSAILVDQARTRTYSLGSGYRLYGQVVFAGEPVKNALVSISGGKIDSSILTDARGRYSFSLSGGSYELNVAPQPDSLARLPFRLLSPHTACLSLAEDTQLNIELKQGISVCGKVLDHLQKPRAGVQLSLYHKKGDLLEGNGGQERPIAFAISGDDGSYEFRVTPGEYFLVMNNQKESAQALVACQGDLRSDLTWQGACQVSFEIVSEFDEPVSHCQVFYHDYKKGGPEGGGSAALAPSAAITGDDGLCIFTLPSGIYSFYFQPPAQGSFQTRQIRQLSINGDLSRKIRLLLKEEGQ